MNVSVIGVVDLVGKLKMKQSEYLCKLTEYKTREEILVPKYKRLVEK